MFLHYHTALDHCTCDCDGTCFQYLLLLPLVVPSAVSFPRRRWLDSRTVVADGRRSPLCDHDSNDERRRRWRRPADMAAIMEGDAQIMPLGLRVTAVDY